MTTPRHSLAPFKPKMKDIELVGLSDEVKASLREVDPSHTTVAEVLVQAKWAVAGVEPRVMMPNGLILTKEHRAQTVAMVLVEDSHTGISVEERHEDAKDTQAHVEEGETPHYMPKPNMKIGVGRQTCEHDVETPRCV